MSPYKLSIILPVYNVENYIEECITSILNIQNVNFELIIVDDGSTDNSIARIKPLILNHYNIKLIRQENRGLSAARNSGLQIASGDYIWFVDSDDVIDYHNLAKLFSNNLSEDIIIFDFIKFDGGKINEYRAKISQLKKLTGIECLNRYYLHCLYTVVWRYLYRRTYLINNGFFFLEGSLYEDVEWTPRVLYMAETVTYIPLIIYKYRIRNNSIVNSSFREKNFDDILKVCHSLSRFIKSKVLNRKSVNVIQDSMNYFLLMALSKVPHSLFVEYKSVFREMGQLKEVSYKYKMINCLYPLFPNVISNVLKYKFKGL